MRLSHIVLVALATLMSSLAARAEESGCDKFAWPVQAEQKLLQRPDKIAAQSGKSFSGLSNGPIELSLLRLNQAGFDKPPERAPKNPDSFAGFLKLAAIPAGVVQISLSRAAWIDAIQEGRYLKPAAHSGALDCPGIRKIVKFELQQGPVIFQLSGVEANSLALLIAPPSTP
ncbi:MAG TPA: hypothetical protein VN919_00460 [Xanthobacteraceae bacterium]|jgi:hypothetical protein|nr:hypothetical protein [Xanthobacteraceae bacterium]